MARVVLLTWVGIFGGAAVLIAGLNAHDPKDALRAIAAGVGLLIFVAGVGLAELLNLNYQSGDALLRVSRELEARREAEGSADEAE
jgi:hypothetical protein